MRPEDLFELIDGIDDDIILDAAKVNNEEPTEVVIGRGRTPFRVAALSAACLLCVMVSGVFVVARLRSGLPTNSGSNSPTASAESSFESASSSDSSDNSYDLKEEFKFYSNILIKPEKRFDCVLEEYVAAQTLVCVKDDDLAFAAVYIDSAHNITEDSPVYITIWKEDGGERICVSEPLIITSSEPQKHYVAYTKPCGRSSRCFLTIQYKGEAQYKEETTTHIGSASINGYWEP